MVFKFAATTRLSDTVLEGLGVEILGEDEDWTYFALVDQEAHERLERVLTTYEHPDQTESSSLPVTLAQTLDTIEGIELYGPQDRLDPSLVQPVGTETVEVQIRIWPTQSQDEAARRVQRVVDLLDGVDGCQVLASTDRPQTTAVVGEITAAGIALLSELSVVERVTPPMRAPLSASDIERAGVDDIPHPAGAAIGVIDDGPLLTNPLMAMVVKDHAAFPPQYAWNPPSRHGVAVASLAAFYEFETYIAGAEPLRTPHPIVMARVLHPLPGPDQVVGVPRGQFLWDTVEAAVRWLHSVGVRVVNLSINSTDPADTRALPEELTYVLDTLARELNIVVVLSAGNLPRSTVSPYYASSHYPDYLRQPEAGIADPGLASNALTVGGQARNDICSVPNWAGIAPAGGPSPFTRTGTNARKGRLKPDVVHWAGNWGWNHHLQQEALNEPSLSVTVASTVPGQTFDWTNGTSFAAPRVAHIAAEVFSRYPDASANLVRALVLLSARQSETARDQFVDRAERQQVTGTGIPDPERAVNSGGNRVVLTFEGIISCDTTTIHRVPIPREFTRGRHKRRIRVAVACDPPVRRTRREYVAGHLQISLLRAMSEDEVLEVFRRQPSSQARRRDPSLSVIPLPKDRRRPTLQPGHDDVTRTTAYVSEFATVQLLVDDGDTYFVAVTHEKALWRNLTNYQEQRYAIAVELADEGPESIDLYNVVRARLQARVRQQVRHTT